MKVRSVLADYNNKAQWRFQRKRWKVYHTFPPTGVAVGTVLASTVQPNCWNFSLEDIILRCIQDRTLVGWRFEAHVKLVLLRLREQSQQLTPQLSLFLSQSCHMLNKFGTAIMSTFSRFGGYFMKSRLSFV